MSLRATFRRAWPVLLSYGIFSMWGVGCLFASVVLTSGGFGVSAGDVPVLLGILAATFGGHVAGNLLGLARLRLLPVAILFTLLFFLATMSGFAIGAFAVFLVIALFAAVGGYLGIASRLDVVAAWYPLSFCVGGAIVWMNRHGAVATFNSGAKHMVWDAFTILCLVGGVFLMLVFLATRNALGLTVWQEVARTGTADAEAGTVAVARPGRGSLFVLFAFTLVILGTTALLSPYLFRTRAAENGEGGGDESGETTGKTGKKGDRNGDGKTHGKDGHGKGDGTGEGGGRGKGNGKGGGGKHRDANEGDEADGTDQGDGHRRAGHGKGNGDGTGGGRGKGDRAGGGGKNRPKKGKGQGEGRDQGDGDPIGEPDTDSASEAAREGLELGMKILAWLLGLAALLLFLFLVFVPPIRRAFLLRHLEKPLWPVAPTARVMNLWRRALAMLAMVDIEPSPGETPRDFAKRAEEELMTKLGCDAPDLRAAAAIVEKIDYAGRGLGPEDEQTMRDAVMRLLRTVGARIGTWKKVSAGWGRAPEVES